MLATQKAFDSFTFAHDLDFDNYSGLVAVGGDGTMNEVVNGMLARPDKRRLPIGLIGNGSGDLSSLALGITDVNTALDYIVSASAIKADIYKVLVDHEEDINIP